MLLKVFATFLEKVAQKSASLESLALPGTTASRAAFKERSRPVFNSLNALRYVEANTNELQSLKCIHQL